MEIFLVILSWILFGGAASYFANERGRDPFAWFFIGMFLGVIGVILLFLLPKVEVEEELEVTPTSPLLSKEDPMAGYKLRDWYYIDGTREQRGPSSFSELRKLWEKGSLNAETFVWCDGMAEWKRIEDLPQIKKELD